MSEIRSQKGAADGTCLDLAAAQGWQRFKAALLAFQHSPTLPNADAVMAAQAPFLVAYGLDQAQRAHQARLLAAKLALRLAVAEFADTTRQPVPGQAVH